MNIVVTVASKHVEDYPDCFEISVDGEMVEAGATTIGVIGFINRKNVSYDAVEFAGRHYVGLNELCEALNLV